MVQSGCGRGETGRRKALKMPHPKGYAGSIPAVRTNFSLHGVSRREFIKRYQYFVCLATPHARARLRVASEENGGISVGILPYAELRCLHAPNGYRHTQRQAEGAGLHALRRWWLFLLITTREDAKRELANGEDPSVIKRRTQIEAAAAAGNTFGVVADDYLARLESKGSAAKQGARICSPYSSEEEMSLETEYKIYMLPVIDLTGGNRRPAAPTQPLAAAPPDAARQCPRCSERLLIGRRSTLNLRPDRAFRRSSLPRSFLRCC